MRYALFAVLTSLVLASCSDSDEPATEVHSRVAEITDVKSVCRKILYDESGRVTEYAVSFPGETIRSTYSYTSDDFIRIHTEHRIHGFLPDGEDAVRAYDDEMHLENGRVSSCEGIFSTNQFAGGNPFQKKYRQEFTYTAENQLTAVRNTEWNRKADSWAYDRPWTWENRYIWENGNLTAVEDYAGNEAPTYIYRYSYTSISGVRNIVPVHMDRYQYFPLQLNGYFGAEPENLISRTEYIRPDAPDSDATYQYSVDGNRITGYTETHRGTTYDYIVTWTE